MGCDRKLIIPHEGATTTEIEGFVEGDVHDDMVVVRRTGFVRGMVHARHAIIYGHVEGGVQAHILDLREQSRVLGAIRQNSLTITPGAHFEGDCSIKR